jgi:predicted transcriptional regulator of viral defense system
MQSIENNMFKKISGHGKGWAFSPKDVSPLASREAVDRALHRLEKKGTIRRVLRGLYLLGSQAAGPRSDIDAKSTDHLQGIRDAPMLLEVAERV